jgi:hypothetical protein
MLHPTSMKKLISLLFALAPMLVFAQVQVAPIVNPHIQLFNAGVPCNGCLLDTFSAGTTTPLVTYSESTGTTPNANPVVADSNGFVTVYMTTSSYKLRLRTAAGVTIWTQDGVTWNNLATTLTSITSTGNAIIKPAVAATGGANQSSPTLCIDGFYFNVTSLTDQWCFSDVLGTGTTPTNTLTLTHSGSSGTSSVSLPGNVSVGGKFTGSNWNNVRVVDGATLVTIQNCIDALPATGGTCLVPPNNVNGEYVENMTANIVFKKNTHLWFPGQCQITQNGFIVSIPQGADDVSIISPFVHSSDQGGNAQGCSFVGYTGAGAAIDVGSSAGFTYNTLIRGIQVNLFSAQAGAIAYRLTNEVQGALDDDACTEGPVSGQKCYATVGTGALFAGLIRILSPECSAAPGATNNFCIQLGPISNDILILGGHANILGSGANNSVCIDVSGTLSGNNQLYGFDCDTGVTAVTIESTVNRGLYAVINVDSGVTNGANFGAGSFGNVVIINGNLPVVDSGTAGTNTYMNPARSNQHTDVWQTEATSSFWLLTGIGAGSYVPYAASIGGNNKISSFTGSETDININSGCGLGLFNETVRVLTWDCNGTQHPAVAGAVGLGTAALPEKNLIMGTAATNNFTFTPAATSAARTVNINDPGVATVNMGLVIASGTAVMPVTAFGAAGCNTAVTVAATGALTTDTIEWAFTADPGATVGYSTGALHIYPYVTSGNVNFRQCSSSALTPGAATLNWRVVR